MALQFGRRCNLIVSTASDGLDLSEFRISFRTQQADVETPNAAFIRVYNLSDRTSQQINDEFLHVTLQAGYEASGAYGVIFDGTIKQVRRGRESETDTYLDIIAADGDIAYNNAVTVATLAAGSTAADRVAVAATAMAAQGVGQEPLPDLGAAKLPRGRVVYGMARDVLREVATSTLTTWSIAGGKLVMIPKASYRPGDVVVLNRSTGMIGLPTQTQEGIYARCLLNPNLGLGRRVYIDPKVVQEFQQSLNVRYTAFNALVPKIARDGLYKSLVVEHEGDTRGNPWYTNLTCLALDAITTRALAGRGIAG